LWALDLAFADVIATSSDPRLGAIRLAWWRERLDEIDGGSPPFEPRLEAVARELIPRGVTGHELSHLEDAWFPLLDPFPWGEAQAEGMKLRGRLLFGIGARLLGAKARDAEQAGELWSLEDTAKLCSDDQSRRFLLQEATETLPQLQSRTPTALRSLTVLAALAGHSVRPGRFGRGWAALKHRLTGRFPR
jgi:phytoene synthase